MTDRKEAGAPVQASRCRLCGEMAEHVFSASVLGRHKVGYFYCAACGLIQTEEPYWLEEAYSQAISSADTGIMARNLYLMRVMAVLFKALRIKDGICLDYGGGHGVFTRLMRDLGFDFRWWDPHAENIFARGFEYEEGMPVEVVTATEVLEHLEKPHSFFAHVLGKLRPKLLLATTETFTEPVDPDWHYFYFATGQHIAFYQRKTLKKMADRYDYHYYSVNALHVFSKKELPTRLLTFCIRVSRYIYPLLRFGSLVQDDHQKQMKQVT